MAWNCHVSKNNYGNIALKEFFGVLLMVFIDIQMIYKGFPKEWFDKG